MLTDDAPKARNGVTDMADEVARQGGSLVSTILLGVLVFAVGAALGFAARLLWPRAR